MHDEVIQAFRRLLGKLSTKPMVPRRWLQLPIWSSCACLNIGLHEGGDDACAIPEHFVLHGSGYGKRYSLEKVILESSVVLHNMSCALGMVVLLDNYPSLVGVTLRDSS